MKSVVADLAAYDWEGDTPLGRPFSRTVIYELHVRGFTAHPNSGVDRRPAGTYATSAPWRAHLHWRAGSTGRLRTPWSC
jgi:pullulanase/glycogen debranching enzyme